MTDGFIDERFRTYPQWDDKGWVTWTTFCVECDVSASFQYGPDQDTGKWNREWIERHERMVHKGIKKLRKRLNRT